MALAWTGWLVLLLVIFALLEGYALARRRMTLSRFVWIISQAWPPFPFICGLVIGGLAAHFWWIGQGCDLVTK